MIIRFLLWLCRHTPPRVIMARDGKAPYLTRYFLTRGSPKTEGMDRHTSDAPLWGLYLHRFHRSDDGAELHNHPWRWAVSLVLKGGYSEERRGPGFSNGGRFYANVERREVKPWRLNFLRGNTFHRVDLTNGEAWTLFLVGPVTKSWGFWDRKTGVYTPWRRFLGLDS